MGSGASAAALFDVAKDLHLNHEQRQRFKAYHAELALKGTSEAMIREKLVAKFKSEKGGELNEEELRSTRKITKFSDEYETRSLRITKSNANSLISEKESSFGNSKNNNVTTIEEEKQQESGKGNNITDIDTMKVFNCEICKTTFKSSALLERHVKYSYIHARTLQDFEASKKQEDRAKRIAVMVHNSIQAVRKSIMRRDLSARNNRARSRWFWAYDKVKMNIAIARTTEMLTAHYRSNLKKTKMDHAKMLYDGSKLFWRTQESIELHIYLHDDEDVKASMPNKSAILEIVGFDVTKQKELMRLYANFNVLQSHLLDKIQAAVLAHQEKIDQSSTGFSPAASTYKFNINKLDKDESKIMYKVISDYIVSKLDIQSHPNRPTQKGLVLGDVTDDLMSDVMFKSPAGRLSPRGSHPQSGSATGPERGGMFSARGAAPSTMTASSVKGTHSNISAFSPTTTSGGDNVITASASTTNIIGPVTPVIVPIIPGVNNNQLSTSVPPDTLIDESTVLKLIKPVEILRRRRTTEEERNYAFADFNKQTNELSNFTNKATEHALNTNVNVIKRTGLKHDESEALDDVIAKYTNLMKQSSSDASLVETNGGYGDDNDDAKIANNNNNNKSPTAKDKAAATPALIPWSSNKSTGSGSASTASLKGTAASQTRLVVDTSDQDENVKRYMRPIAAQVPEKLILVNKVTGDVASATGATTDAAVVPSSTKSTTAAVHSNSSAAGNSSRTSNNATPAKPTGKEIITPRSVRTSGSQAKDRQQPTSARHAAGSGAAAAVAVAAADKAKSRQPPLNTVPASPRMSATAGTGAGTPTHGSARPTTSPRGSQTSARLSSREPSQSPRDSSFRLTQPSIHQQREEAAALKEMIIHSARSEAKSNGIYSVAPKLPEMPEHESDDNDNDNYEEADPANNNNNSQKKKTKKTATATTSNGGVSKLPSLSPRSLKQQQQSNDNNSSSNKIIEEDPIMSYFEKRDVIKEDHTPIVSSRRSLKDGTSMGLSASSSSGSTLTAAVAVGTVVVGKVISPQTSARGMLSPQVSSRNMSSSRK